MDEPFFVCFQAVPPAVYLSCQDLVVDNFESHQEKFPQVTQQNLFISSDAGLT